MLEPGKTGRYEVSVTDQKTALAMGSGDMAVFATPAMAALMEAACVDCVKGLIEPENSTVGVALDLKHIAATPVGMTVRAEATLTEVSGRKLTFRVEAYDEKECIGTATHERVIVGRSRFMEKTNEKGNGSC